MRTASSVYGNKPMNTHISILQLSAKLKTQPNEAQESIRLV